jgi:hypothetical protein
MWQMDRAEMKEGPEAFALVPKVIAWRKPVLKLFG